MKNLILTTPSRLSIDGSTLKADGVDHIVRFTLSDLQCVIVETPQVTLTAAVPVRLAEAGVLLAFCDHRHMPTVLSLPASGHWRAAQHQLKQLKASDNLKSQLWRHIIRLKLKNQAVACKDRRGAAVLNRLADRTSRRGADASTLEARGARIYWHSFRTVASGFRRKPAGGDRVNSLLDYGYAIVRAALARAVCAQGLVISVGLAHQGRTNPMNLVDDLIEPFRPFVDQRVAARLAAVATGDELTREDKVAMLEILTDKLPLAGELLPLAEVMDLCAESLNLSFQESKNLLVLPEMR